MRNTLSGHAAREIVEGAKLHDVGIIVMGSRGRSDLAGLVLRSTAHKVIHLADPPRAGCSLIEMTDWVAAG